MLKPNDKETEYMKMKIINSSQKSFLHWRLFQRRYQLQLLKKEQNENELQHNKYHVILDPLPHYQELFLLSHIETWEFITNESRSWSPCLSCTIRNESILVTPLLSVELAWDWRITKFVWKKLMPGPLVSKADTRLDIDGVPNKNILGGLSLSFLYL